MNTKVVKNISGQDLVIPNVGLVKAGETIKVSKDFHNGNFEVVKDEVKKEEIKSEKPKK